MKLSLILEAVDRMSAPLRKVKAATSGATKGMAKAGEQAEKAARPVARLSTAMKHTSTEAGKVSLATAGAARGIAKVGDEAEKSRRPMFRLSSLIKRTSVDTVRLHGIAYGAGRAIGGILRGIAIVASVGVGSLGALSASFATAVVKAGMKYDQAFSKKVTASTTRLTTVFTAFMLKIGKAGVFDFIAAKLQEVSAWADRMAANGTLDKWAKQIGAALVDVGKWVASIDWPGLARDIFSIAKALFNVGRFIAAVGGGGLGGIFNVAIVAVIAKIGFALYGLGGALGVVSIAGAPLWAVVAAIAALAAGAFLVWRNWDNISAKLRAIWEGFKSAVADAVAGIVGFFRSMWPSVKSAFATGIEMLWNSLPLWFRGILSGTAFVIRTIASGIAGAPPSKPPGGPPRFGRGGGASLPPLQSGAPLPPRTARGAPPPAKAGNATISLNISTDRGVSVRPTRMKADGVDVEVNTGRAMAGPA